MEHIETIELDSSQASITFSSIPQDYDDLVVMTATRNSGNEKDVFIDVNGGSSLTNIWLYSDGTVKSTTGSDAEGGLANESGQTANTFSSSSIYIPNYTLSNTKTYSIDSVQESNDTSPYMYIAAGSFNTTSAITSLSFTVQNNDFVTGSTFSLYGITAGGDGTVTTA